MTNLSAKYQNLDISLHKTPSAIFVDIRTDDNSTKPWEFFISWGLIKQKGAYNISRWLTGLWQKNRPVESSQILLSGVLQILVTLFSRAGSVSPEYSLLSALPSEKGWQVEERFFMGENGFGGYFREELVQIRYLKQDDGLIRILPDYAPLLPSILISKKQFKNWFLSKQHIREALYKNRNEVRKQSKTLCYNPQCPTNQLGIRSHILQQKGVFSNIVESIKAGYVIVELTINNVHNQAKTGLTYGFRTTGVNASHELAFWGFCNPCDRNTFYDIEHGNRDFTNIRNQLLLSYRAHLNELYKTEYNVWHWRAVRESSHFSQYIKDYSIRKQISQARMCQVNYHIKLILEQALSNLNAPAPFKFIHFTLPKVLVATSVTYSSRAQIRTNYTELLNFKPDYKQAINLTEFAVPEAIYFLHLIPEEYHLTVVIGYNESTTHIREFPITDISLLTNNHKFKLISDILIAQAETWCVSPSIYEIWKASGKDLEILKAIEYHLPLDKKYLPISINLFEGLV